MTKFDSHINISKGISYLKVLTDVVTVYVVTHLRFGSVVPFPGADTAEPEGGL